VVVVATAKRRIPVATLTSHQIMLGVLGQIDRR
jgi:hypothetical protein